jgi:site-specific DNA-methyltransferase (cytosine-N4-specific)
MNKIFFGDSSKMEHIDDSSVDLIVTSPPYFNIKDYSKDGKQEVVHSEKKNNDLGAYDEYDSFIDGLLMVWKECERVLVPNGKLIINTPLMPIKKSDYTSHYNRDVFNLDSDIQHSIRKNTKLYLYDLYIWNRTNPTKSLMFGSYPHPGNFYAQNTSEFITVYVKDGKPKKRDKTEKEKNIIEKDVWVNYTKQIWDIPIPNKSDLAFGEHSAIMPEEIVKRCITLFTYENDVVLDPFCGSGTTLKVAKEMNRNYIGYELYENYSDIINKKLNSVSNG